MAFPIRKRKWRSTEEIIHRHELEFAASREVPITRWSCPCNHCRGGHRYSSAAITTHLNSYGRDPFLFRSMIGGDPPGGYPEDGAWYYSDDDWTLENEGRPQEDFQNPVPEDKDLDLDQDGQHDVHKLFEDALRTAEELEEIAHGDEVMHQEDIGDTEFADSTIEALELLYSEASHPLYPGSTVSLISAVVVIMTLCSTHGVSNAFVTELLHYLSEELLPKGDVLPAKHYTAKRMLQALGLSYNIIHACPAGCVLFRGEHQDCKSCPHCGKSRYREGTVCHQ